MEPVFVHRQPDRWDFGDLMSDRLGIVALRHLVAPAALGRLAVDDVAELLGGDEWAGRVYAPAWADWVLWESATRFCCPVRLVGNQGDCAMMGSLG
jgi:hypothetical protein